MTEIYCPKFDRRAWEWNKDKGCPLCGKTGHDKWRGTFFDLPRRTKDGGYESSQHDA